MGIGEIVEHFHDMWGEHLVDCRICCDAQTARNWPECQEFYCDEWKKKWAKWDEETEDVNEYSV
jgi:hypothetical protein